MSSKRWWTMSLAVLAFCALATMVACAHDGDGTDDFAAGKSGLVQCDDCDDVANWIYKVAVSGMMTRLEQNLEDQLRGGYYDDDDWDGGDDDVFGDDEDSGDDDSAPDDNSGDDDDEDHSDTNVQEEGVDEADLVKTDGDLLYITTGGTLLIFDATPAADTAELSRVDIEGVVLEMFLYDDVVLVFSSLWDHQVPESVWPDVPRSDLAWTVLKMTVVDVSDSAHPAVIRELYAEGNYLSSRRIDASARVAIRNDAYVPGVEYWVDPYEEGCYDQDWNLDEDCLRNAYDRLAERNREIILNTPYEEWLPRYFDIVQTTDGAQTDSGYLSDCVNFYHPEEMLGTGILSIVSIVLDDPQAHQADVSVIAEGQIVYASTEALYVTGLADTYANWRGSGEEVSDVHKFDIASDPGQAIYRGSGSVDGWVLNQFSLSEYDGVLRVATTVGDWGSGTGSNVFCLEERDGALVTIGALRNIMPGERIYAARFRAEKGFLVTFEQTDPLFTIDLSDPTDPTLVGELEVPGYSTYLHPIDDDHLLAIGVGGDEWGSTWGISLSLFDVSDFAAPTRDFYTEVGDSSSYSDAQYNHKAFLYYEPFDLLSIPLSTYGWGDDDDVDDGFGEDDRKDGEEFAGFYIYQVTVEDGFAQKGEVSHLGMEGEEGSDPHYWNAYPLRSVVIGEGLYTISDVGLVVSSLPGFEELARIDLPYEDPYSDYYGDDDWYDDDDDWGDDDVDPRRAG